MGSVLYTRTGDKGTTHLGDNRVVPKDARRVTVSGVIDEGTSALGMARSYAEGPLVERIRELQRELIKLMARVSLYDPDARMMTAEDLERRIEEVKACVQIEPEFIEPGESVVGGALHLARTIFRRAEREAVALAREEGLPEADLKFINRLSDYAYALATWADYQEAVKRIAKIVTRELGGRSTIPETLCMTYETAKILLARMEARAVGGSVPMAMAVCDACGALVAFGRQDGTLPVSVDLARKKAYTATRLKCPTADLAELTQPGAPLWGLQSDPELVVIGGGFPLFAGGRLVGAVGVSGGTVDEDMAVAQAALDAWNE